jgi:cytosine deaminase
MSILIKNARLRETKDSVDILIDETGKIIDIRHGLNVSAEETIDAQQNLVTPTFVDPHLHLDKAFTALDGRISTFETLEESLQLMHDIKRKYTVEDVKSRAVKAIEASVRYGCTKIRANADVDSICGLTALKGVLEAKKECKDIADIQVVAFPQEGIFVDEGTEELLYKSMDLGADLIGGMPALEWSDDDGKKHVDIVFEIAKRYNVDIDFHLDQIKDPFSRYLEYTAIKTIREGYQGRVTAGHCVSLAWQTDAHAQKVISLVKKANINICVNPAILAIMGIDPEPRTRGITRVRDLVKAGVNVTTSQDTICDQFHLYGTGDPLDYGLLLAYAAQYNSNETAEIVYDMITFNAARAMRLDEYGIKVGNRANLNIIEAPNVREALRLRPSRLYVIRNGKIIARTIQKSEILSC